MARRKQSIIRQANADKLDRAIHSDPSPSSFDRVSVKDTELSAAVRRLERKRLRQEHYGDCDAGIHQGAIPKHRLVTKHGTTRAADLRRRVTLTDCDTDSGRRHLKVGRCRRRHSIHDLDDQRAVSAMDGILLDVGHAGRSEEACYLDALHPNSSCSQSCTSLSSDGSKNRHTEVTRSVATKKIHHVTNPQEDTFSEPILNPNELNELYWTTKTQMLQLVEDDLKLRLELKSMKEDFLKTLHALEAFRQDAYSMPDHGYDPLIHNDASELLVTESCSHKRSQSSSARNSQEYAGELHGVESHQSRRKITPPCPSLASEPCPSVTSDPCPSVASDPCPSLASEPCPNLEQNPCPLMTSPHCRSDSHICHLGVPTYSSVLTTEGESIPHMKQHPMDLVQPPVPHQSLADSGTDITSSNTTADSGVSRCPTTSDATGSSLDPPWTSASPNVKLLMESPRYSSRHKILTLSNSNRRYRRRSRRIVKQEGSVSQSVLPSEKCDSEVLTVEGPLQSTFLYPDHSTPARRNSRRRLKLEESHISSVSDGLPEPIETVALGVKEFPPPSGREDGSDDCNNNSKGRDQPEDFDIPKPSPLDNFFHHNPSVKRRNKRQNSTRRPPLLPLPSSPKGHRSSSENPNFYFETSSPESTPIAMRTHTWAISQLPSPGYGYEDSGMLFDSSPTMIARDESIPGYDRRRHSQTSSNLSPSAELKLDETETKGMLGEFIVNLQTLHLSEDEDPLQHLELISEPETVHPVTPCDGRKMRRQTGQTELFNVQDPIGLSETDLLESSNCQASKIYCSIEATRASVPDLSSVSTPPSSYRGNSSSSCYKDSSYKESDGMWSPPKSTDSISTGPSLPKVASGVGSTFFWDPSAATSSDSYGGFVPPRNSPENSHNDINFPMSNNSSFIPLDDVNEVLTPKLASSSRPPCIGQEVAIPTLKLDEPSGEQVQLSTGDVQTSEESLEIVEVKATASAQQETPNEKCVSSPGKPKSGIRRSLSKRFKTLGRSILKRPFKSSKTPSDGSGG